MDALIGSTGYVGTTLLRQRAFDAQFHSTDIGQIRGKSFDLVVCAGVSAKKWLANKDPEADRAGIQALLSALEGVAAKRFVLISTVDVFQQPAGVTEEDEPSAREAYGKHRLELEQAVRQRFASTSVVRLPGLVGPGLRKNAIFDLHHGNQVDRIDRRGMFQFYPMVNLWTDLRRSLEAGLDLVHLCAEPVAIADVAREVFKQELTHEAPKSPQPYDLRTVHAQRFGKPGDYQYSRTESFLAIRAYARSEPRAAKEAT